MGAVKPFEEYIEKWSQGDTVKLEEKYRVLQLSLLDLISDQLFDMSCMMQSNHAELLKLTPDTDRIESLLEKQMFFSESTKELAKAIVAASCIDSHLRRGTDYMQIVDELRNMNTVLRPYLGEIS